MSAKDVYCTLSHFAARDHELKAVVRGEGCHGGGSRSLQA